MHTVARPSRGIGRLLVVSIVAWLALTALLGAWQVGFVGLGIALAVSLVVWSVLGYRRT